MKTKMIVTALTIISVGASSDVAQSEVSPSGSPAPFMLLKDVFIAAPSDLPFQAAGGREFGLGARGPKYTEKFWTVNSEGTTLTIKYWFVPGRPNKEQQSNEFVDSITQNVVTNNAKRNIGTTDFRIGTPEKIVNGNIRGHILTLDGAGTQTFFVNSPPMNIRGNYSCVTEGYFSRLSNGLLAKQQQTFIAFVGSQDCNSDSHRKAVAAIKSLSG
jgi:hypothetical protein